MDELVIIAEKFYAQFYDTDTSPQEISDGSGLKEIEARAITNEQVERALRKMSGGKTAGEVFMTGYLIQDGGSIL